MIVPGLRCAVPAALLLVLPVFGTGQEGLWRPGPELDFRHWNGASGEWYFPEINGAGVALFDYDNDGDLDIYLVQGAPLGSGKALVPPPEHPPRDRLFRNDLGRHGFEGSGPAFVDVTENSGIGAFGYGMAVAAADFDDDGWVDLYLGNYGSNQLWRNRGPNAEGEVTFEDVTDAWRADDRRWTAALAVFDYDRDGDLDLYLGNYLRFELARHKQCTISTGRQDYCHPSSYAAETDLLLRNTLDDGKPGFVDATRRALGKVGAYPTLGLAVLDADGDSRLDLYVANDDQPNLLWRNLGPDPAGDGASRFAEDALLTGAAVNGLGRAEASMGLAAGDVDGDGDEDLFAAHLDGQTNTLYINDGGIFRDQTRQRGLGVPSLPYTAFGTAFVDGDLDGDLDLVVVNGAVQVSETLRRKRDPHPFHQVNQYFENDGTGRFTEAGSEAGSGLKGSEVSRGLAVGDLDNDGDPDLVITNNHGPARLALGTVREPGKATGPHWIGLRLTDPSGRRDLLGTVVKIVRPGKTLVRRSGVDGSYASSRDPRVLVGLGTDPKITRVEVVWPQSDGSVEVFHPSADRYSTLRRGTGTAGPGAENPGAASPGTK